MAGTGDPPDRSPEDVDPSADEPSSEGRSADGAPVPPLTVYPPPDDESAPPDALGADAWDDDGQSAPPADEVSFAGIAADAMSPVPDGGDSLRGFHGVDGFDASSPADDESSAGHEVGVRAPTVFVPDASPDEAGEDAATVLGEHLTDEGEQAADSPSESALFNAVVEESTGFEGIGPGSESYAGDSQGGGEAAALAAELAAVTAAAGNTRSHGTRASGGGLRQVAGIVLGGVLAIPVAYAILLWGFQRDPFRIARALPEPVRALLPARVRSARPPSRMPSLDSLPPPATERLQPAAMDGLPPAAVHGLKPPATDGVIVDAAAIASAEPQPGLPGGGVAAAPTASPRPVSVPAVEGGTAPPADAGPRATGQQPIDRTLLASAIARAEAAAGALTGGDGGVDRERLLVDWYRALAAAVEIVVDLDKDPGAASAPLVAPHRELTGAALREADGGNRVADLRALGAMWLERSDRETEGVVLVGVLHRTTEQAAVWSSQVVLEEAGDVVPAGAPRRVVVVSRRPPAAAVGDTVFVAGVILDAGVVWAADVWGPAL